MKQSLFFFLFLYSFLANCQQADKVKVEKPGTLSTLLTKAQQDTCKHLVVSGKLNSADIKVLRKMAGADGFGNLQVLDLKDAKIIPCEEPYLIIRNAEEKVLLGRCGGSCLHDFMRDSCDCHSRAGRRDGVDELYGHAQRRLHDHPEAGRLRPLAGP